MTTTIETAARQPGVDPLTRAREFVHEVAGSSSEVERILAEIVLRLTQEVAPSMSRLVEAEGVVGLERLGNPTDIAHRMGAVLPSPHPFNAFGPFYRASEAAAWLGESRQSIHQKVRRRSLVGAQDSSGALYLPTWQFRPDGTVLPRLREAVDALASGTDNAWTWIQWLAAPGPVADQPAWLTLASGDRESIELVLSEARADASRWAS